MKREEKNRQTQRRILDSALAEFAAMGYASGSINTVSNAQGLSKGIIYHYFPSKEALYLACVEECFTALTAYLKENLNAENEAVEEQLKSYFNIRISFFRRYPLYQRIFCEAIIMPPSHLAATIQTLGAAFDALNVEILEKLLESVTLRSDITKEQVIDIFRVFQDYINAKYQMMSAQDVHLEEREACCRRALDVLLYGVVTRKSE